MSSFYLFILVALALLLCYSNYRRSQQIKKRKEIMKIGQVKTWLDQGPVILLGQCKIPDPVWIGDKEVYMNDPHAWPSEIGWTVKLLETNEILDVHEETLS